MPLSAKEILDLMQKTHPLPQVYSHGKPFALPVDKYKWARRVLGFYAGMSEQEVGAEPSRALKLARAAVHPDKKTSDGRDRREWDLVEECARLLGLVP